MHVIHRKIEFRKCPGCGYAIHQELIDASRFNYKCPRCDLYHLSQFEPVTNQNPDPDKPRFKKLKKAA